MAVASHGLVRNSVGKHPAVTLERLEKALSTLYFPEHNMSGIWLRRLPDDAVRVVMQARTLPHAAAAPRPIPNLPGSRPAGRVARTWRGPPALSGPIAWEPISVGHSFGPSWSTHVVCVRFEPGPKHEALLSLLPEHGLDPVVFVWDSSCEAAAWVDGTTVCGLTGGGGGELPENSDRRAEVLLAAAGSPGLAGWIKALAAPPGDGRDRCSGAVRSLVVEVACNGMFGPGGATMIAPPDPHKTFALSEARPAVLDRLGWRLYHAFLAAVDLAKACPEGSSPQRRALFAGNAALNSFDRRNRATWLAALEALQPLFQAPLLGSVPAAAGAVGPSQRRRGPRVHAIGHCHIDTAWLWPVAESARKARRSWASVLDLSSGRAPGAWDGEAGGAAAAGAPRGGGGPRERPGPLCAWGEGPSPLVFAVSQAAQADMLLAGEPREEGGGGPAGAPAAAGDGALFDRLRAAVAAGVVVPVGAMWVEPDANLISGESWARQMAEARAWYVRHLVTASGAGRYVPGGGHSPADVEGAAEAGAAAAPGATAAAPGAAPAPSPAVHGVAWLPDTFGMQCAQLPHLLRSAGLDSFLTQKLSWSLVHKHPHSTFWWRAPGGDRVLAHFPPSDSYNTKARADDVAKSQSQNKDAGRCDVTAMLYGHGDGGGGPTAAMLASLSLLDGAEGMPEVVAAGTSPAAVFEDAAADVAASRAGLSTWDGEIHLELHQGTYTSVPALKRAHQDAETSLLLTAEAAASLALVRARGRGSRAGALRAAASLASLVPDVRRLLTCQFHDILPGTSIALAQRLAIAWLRRGDGRARRAARRCCREALGGGAGAEEKEEKEDEEGGVSAAGCRAVFNASTTHASGLIRSPGAPPLWFSVPPLSPGVAAPADAAEPGPGDVRCSADGSSLSLRSTDGGSSLVVALDAAAGTLSVAEARGPWAAAAAVTGGEPFHHLVSCTDQPWFWDAWDVMTDRSERASLLLGGSRYEATRGGGEPAEPAEPAFEWARSVERSGRAGAWARIDAIYRQSPGAAGGPAGEAAAEEGVVAGGSDDCGDDGSDSDGASSVQARPGAWDGSGPTDPDAVSRSRFDREEEGALTVRLEGVAGPDPLLRVTTAMPRGAGMGWRAGRDSIRVVLRFAGLPTSAVATFGTAFAESTRPATARTAREDMLHETCAHRWVALTAPSGCGAGVIVATRAKHGFEVRGNAVAVTLDRRVEAPDAGPHRTGAAPYAVLFFSGPLRPDVAARAAAAIGPASEVLDCGPAEPGAGAAPAPLAAVEPASAGVLPILEAVKLPWVDVHRSSAGSAGWGEGESPCRLVLRVREAAGVGGVATLRTPAAVSATVVDLVERPMRRPGAGAGGFARGPEVMRSVADAADAAAASAGEPRPRPWWEASTDEQALAGAPGAGAAPEVAGSASLRPAEGGAAAAGGAVTAWRLPLRPLQVRTVMLCLA